MLRKAMGATARRRSVKSSKEAHELRVAVEFLVAALGGRTDLTGPFPPVQDAPPQLLAAAIDYHGFLLNARQTLRAEEANQARESADGERWRHAQRLRAEREAASEAWRAKVLAGVQVEGEG